MAMNRSERRAVEKSARRSHNVRKAGSIGLAVALLSGITAPAAQAVFEDSSDGITMTDKEKADLIQTKNAVMSGSIKATADAKQLAELRALGIDIDIENSVRITNQKLKEGNFEAEFWLDVKFDAAKNKAALESNGMDNTDEEGFSSYVSIATINDEQRTVYGNMATDSTWKAPTFEAGDRLAIVGGAVQDPNSMSNHIDSQADYDAKLGAVNIGQLFPNVGVVNGGATNSKKSEDETTTVKDPYSDTLNNKAYTDGIASANKRGLPEKMDNCLVDNCGIWITAVGNSTTVGQKALAKPLRINIESTVSAGKSPDFKEHTLASGDKYKFSPSNFKRGSYDWVEGYFNDKNLVEYQFASKLAKDVAKVKKQNEANEVDIQSLVFSKGKFEIISEANQDAEFSVDALAKKAIITGETKTPVKTWKYSGEKLSVGSTFEFGFGKNEFEAKVTKITATSITIEATGDNYKSSNVDGVGSSTLAGSLGFYSGSAVAVTSPEVRLQFEKAAKPDKPTPKPEPTPEPEKPKPVSPEAKPDFKKGAHGNKVTIKVTQNDKASKGFKIVSNSVRLIDPKTGKQATTYKVAKQGTYSVSGENVTFTPLKGFEGKANKLTYVWNEKNADGSVTQKASSTVQAEIAPAPKPEKPVEPKPEKPEPVVPTPEKPEPKPEKPVTPTPEKVEKTELPPATETDTDKVETDGSGASDEIDQSSVAVTDTGSIEANKGYVAGGIGGLFLMLLAGISAPFIARRERKKAAKANNN